MNCDRPTIAIRKAGINPATNHNYKPHTFIRFESPEKFVDQYFRFKKYERLVKVSTLVTQSDLDGSHSHTEIQEILQPDQEVVILPCNRPDCILCRQTHRRMWACRIINEAQVSGGGSFLTLTCSDDSIGETFPGMSLRHEPFQKFMKRLRKSGKMIDIKSGKPTDKIRFFMCGEYGERYGRPHYHAVLFGVDFPDRKWVGRSDKGQDIYTSSLIDDLRVVNGKEVFGPVSNFAELNNFDCSYVAGYVDKKLGNADPCIYLKAGINPEYVKMSRRPGIGRRWLEKYHGDIWKFFQDMLLCESVSTSTFDFQVPRYYFDTAKISGLLSQSQCDTIISDRRSRASEISQDPGAMLESLKRAHAKAEIARSKQALQVPRQF